MALSKEKIGEIAFAVLKSEVKSKGRLSNVQQLKRGILLVSKENPLFSIEELNDFSSLLVEESVRELRSKTKKQ